MDKLPKIQLDICAIIPARGGSKAIPKKNLQCVGGKPLIVRTIEAALKSTNINRVIVSTDDKIISEVSKANGAEAFIRSAEISGDDATSESALLDVLNKLKEQENYVPDITVFLQCTSPFTQPEDIDGTINALIQNVADSALAVTEFHHFLWKTDGNNEMVGVNHDEKKSRKRRQDLPIQYLEAGSVYAMRTEGFLKYKNRFFGKITLCSIPKERVFEIDELADLKITENINSILYREFNS